jgi:hypothetical protein
MTAEQKSLIVYLAGPVSNCSAKQKTEWRHDIKKRLKGLGHNWFDPTDHANWTPFREMVQIDKSDVVIANLWRESIGTVVGIVQARRKGKAVILIDPNFIESFLLKEMVGEDYIVHSIEKAINKLQDFVLPQLSQHLKVKKSDGSLEDFSLPKIVRSLNTVCANAHIDDAVLPDLVAREVGNLIRRSSRDGCVSAAEIKLRVFEQLDQLARQSDNLYEEDLKDRARVLKEQWERHELIKKDQRWALGRIDELEKERDLLSSELEVEKAQKRALVGELASLKRDFRELEKSGPEDESEISGRQDEAWEALSKNYINYFPKVSFSEKALRRVSSLRSEERRLFESKFRLLNENKPDGKHQVPGTQPLVWQMDVGREGKLYFQQAQTSVSVVLIGTKGCQDEDYQSLRRKSRGKSAR